MKTLRTADVTVSCPRTCAINVGPTDKGWAVYGFGPFRVDSAICRAAFVAGVLNATGGDATLTYSGRARPLT